MALETGPVVAAALSWMLALVACGPKLGMSDTDGADTSSSGGEASELPAACSLVPDPGGCEAAHARYYFDPVTLRCETFSWGGCDGTVPFDDFEGCQNTCDACGAFFSPLFADEESQWGNIEIRIRNDRAEPIYVRQDLNDFHPQSFILRRAGATVATVPMLCDPLCGVEMLEPCTSSDTAPPPIKIAPGGAYSARWSGMYLAPTELPERCVQAESGPRACHRWFDATPGAYEVEVIAHDSWTCSEADCCTTGAEGWCEAPGYQSGSVGAPRVQQATFSFPGELVELTFM